MAGIEFDDLDGWFREAEAVAERLAEQARTEFAELVKQAEQDMKAAAPKPRTGSRAATIHTTVRSGRRRIVADVGPTAEAFPLVFEEFGSRHQQARPWARPTLVNLWTGWRPWR